MRALGVGHSVLSPLSCVIGHWSKAEKYQAVLASEDLSIQAVEKSDPKGLSP